MKLSLTVPTAYRRCFRFAVIAQALVILFSAFVDDDGSFIPIAAAAWAVFWAGALVLMRRRHEPTKAKLVGLRYGPLAIPIAIFTVSQYL
jgi:MYXO-CTERM domain-containing protein